MLLYLLHDKFRELPHEPSPAIPRLDRNQRALLGAGLFLSLWCVLRLLAARGDQFAVDAPIAVAALCLGLRAIRQSIAPRVR
jgi:hypothetical protein